MSAGRTRPSRDTVGSGIPMDVSVHVDRKLPLEGLSSASHAIKITRDDLGAEILLGEDATTDSAFQLSYSVGLPDEAAGETWVGPEKDGWRELMLLVTPPLDPAPQSVRAKDVLFLTDTSGSMRGGKLDEARQALILSLSRLNPSDRFNLLSFSSLGLAFSPQVRHFKEAFVPVNLAELSEGQSWLDALEAGGGTKLKPALGQALAMPHEASRHQLLVVLTDGMLADEDAVASFLEEHLGETNLLFVGIGADPELRTIQRLADIGRGDAVLARNPQQLDQAMEALLAKFANPVAWNLRIDWGGARVSQVSPSRLPDLHGGRPLTVFARVHGELPQEVRVLGSSTAGGKAFEASARLAEAMEPSRLRRPKRLRRK